MSLKIRNSKKNHIGIMNATRIPADLITMILFDLARKKGERIRIKL